MVIFEWSRYPWLCGYLIAAPGAYWLAQNRIGGCSSWARPLLDGHAGPDVLSFCWYFHFLRRAAEVVFVNRYHGKGIPNERDSVVEAVYYAIWGYINGLTASCCVGEAGGAMDFGDTTAKVGLVIYGLGEIGNFLCHSYLRSLRPDPTDTKWVIPSKFPFDILVAPHYSFELLGWCGYVLAAGFAPPSLIILGLSFAVLIPMSKARKQKYIKLFKDEDSMTNVPPPENRYLLIPFIY